MSLKGFHIVFVAVSALLAVFSAIYAIRVVDGAMKWVWVVLALAAGFVLAAYGRAFLEKMKELETSE